MSTKICKVCNATKPAAQFHGNVCNKCHNKITVDKRRKQRKEVITTKGLPVNLSQINLEELQSNEYVYFIRMVLPKYYHNFNYTKVGFSNDPHTRIKELQTSNPEELFIYRVIPTPNAYKLEQLLHTFLQKERIRCEWFDISPTFIDTICEDWKPRFKHLIDQASDPESSDSGSPEISE